MAGESSPWKPASLRNREDLEAFAYVVVEEEIDGIMGLVVAEWPSGGHGAPHFHQKGEFELAVDREALQRHISDRHVPGTGELPDEVVDELRNRRIQVGDVFAVKPLEDLSAEDPDRLQTCEWMGETLDVTAEAREAAKAKMYEALTPPLHPHVVKQLKTDPERATEPGRPG